MSFFEYTDYDNYQKIEAKKNYKDRIIAFVDILGFKNLVEESTVNKYEFQKILDSLKNFRKLKKEKEDQHHIKDVKVTTFSDSLVISYPLDNSDCEVFYSILLDLTRLQLILLGNNVIIRGGIAIGKLRHTQYEIFGPAMNEAYRLESKIAKYPRIVICEDTVKTYVQMHPSTGEDAKNQEKLESLLRQDSGENIYYLDYLGNPALFNSYEDYRLTLQIIENIIRHGKQADDAKTKSKYDWLEKYYITVLDEVIKENEFGHSNLKETDTDLERANIYYRIAELYFAKCDYVRALRSFIKELEIKEKILGSNSLETAKTYSNIAGVYYCLGNCEKSLEYYRKALTIRENTLGQEHLDTATIYNNMAGVFGAQGNYEKAIEYCNKAIWIREKELGSSHPNTATTYINMALILQSQGDYHKAENYCKKALVVKEKYLGMHHPDTATAENALAGIYLDQNYYEKALEHYRKAITIREIALGTGHPDTACTYNGIADVYQQTHNYSEALVYYEKALVIREKILGAEHPETADSFNGIAIVYQAKHDYTKALEYNKKAQLIREKVLGTNHPETAETYYNLGTVYYDMQRYGEAKTYLQKSYDIRKKILGREHPYTDLTKRTLEIAAKIANIKES